MAGLEDLREGITTGTCAAAATAAACLLLARGEVPRDVTVHTPSGPRRVEVLWVRPEGEGARACVIKDAGDDPDVTHGMAVQSLVTPLDGKFIVDGGLGVGTVTKPGLKVLPGHKAINPVPRGQIMDALREGLPRGGKALIELPDGESLAHKTYNPRLGIVGGLSVLGTKGIVRPMSEEALRATFKADLDVKRAAGLTDLVFTFGNMGEDMAVQALGIDRERIVQVGNEVGYMLKEAHRSGVKRLLIAGHSGKLIKLAAGIFQTHSAVADGRRETLVALAALQGAPLQVLRELDRCTTTEAAGAVLRAWSDDGAGAVWQAAADRAALKARSFLWNDVEIETVMFDNNAQVLARGGGGEK